MYYICRPAQEQQLSVLSGRLVDGDFVFDEHVNGQVLQLWDFEEAKGDGAVGGAEAVGAEGVTSNT